jgi:hypothetical protein
MATVIFGFADGRVSGGIGCDLFAGAFAEVLRLAVLYHATAVWCLPLDVWRMV